MADALSRVSESTCVEGRGSGGVELALGQHILIVRVDIDFAEGVHDCKGWMLKLKGKGVVDMAGLQAARGHVRFDSADS